MPEECPTSSHLGFLDPAVAAVFVTYNRKRDALICVDRLLGQTLPVRRIIVVINGSTDGTEEALRAAYGADERLVLVPLPTNLGNAGGMKTGFLKALEESAIRWLWLLDDDAHAEPDALKFLAEGEMDPSKVYASVVVDPESHDLSFPMFFIDGQKTRCAESLSLLPSADSFEIPCSWLGAAVSRHAIETVGTPDERLFIRGEDVEYAVRLQRAGFRCICRRRAIVVHPTQHLRRIVIFGRTFGYEPGLAIWKFYYLVRNRAHVHRVAAGNPSVGVLKAVASCALWLTSIVLFDKQKLLRSATIVRATVHGITGNFGHGPKPR